MKKIFLLVVGAFTLVIGNNINAQVPGVSHGAIGFRFMPTISSFEVRSSDGLVQAEFTAGYGFGAYAGINFNKHVSTNLEVQYNRLSQKYKDQELERKIHVDYVNIPLLLSLNTNRNAPVNFNVAFGPQLGINVGSDISSSSSSDGTVVRGVLAFKQSDFGIAYGAGLDFGLTPGGNLRLDLGFRGVQGLVDISDESKTIETNEYYILQKSNIRSYSVYAGLTFLFM